MKNLLFILVLCGTTSIVYAQSVPSDAKSETAPAAPLQVYYIDDIRTATIEPVKWMGCGIDMLPVDQYICSGKVIYDPVMMPQRNINSIANTVAGVDSRAGEIPNIRGARPENTAYYVDGMRVSFLNADDMCISMLK
jgi:hypothetical protein